MVTDKQVRRLMEEMAKQGNLTRAAMRSGMDPKTARKYLRCGELPSQGTPGPRWRTRSDPFEEDWPRVERMLEQEPSLEARTIFDFLRERTPGRYQDGQLRTLQRRVKQWRATRGPDKEVFFPQEHRPGEAMQTDFTWATDLEVRVAAVAFPHMLCHSVLPYSNWESATVCHSESMQALRRGMQTALFRLGRCPGRHQTDHSTAATHHALGASEKRRFNQEYEALCAHYGMTPRTTAVGAKEQNGDVESLHRAFKRRLEQALLLRGSRDFESVEAYEGWVWERCQRSNKGRTQRIGEEMAAMRPLVVERLVEWSEIDVRVTSGSTIRVKNNTYSVPSRLIGEKVRVRIHDQRLEIFYGGMRQFDVEKLRGEGRCRIQYRHVIDSLVRKPGAFARYRFREELFPSLVFRRAYDRLGQVLSERRADIEYVRLLQLAAKTTESSVQAILERLEETGEVPLSGRIRESAGLETPEIPHLPSIRVDLGAFDELLEGGMSA